MAKQGMTNLVIFWVLHSMSKTTARRSELEGGKRYKSEVMRTEFPETTPVDDAINELHRIHGERPVQNKSVMRAHTYAEIRGWGYAPSFKREPMLEEKIAQPDLL